MDTKQEMNSAEKASLSLKESKASFNTSDVIEAGESSAMDEADDSADVTGAETVSERRDPGHAEGGNENNVYASISELFKALDPDWKETGEYREAVKTYEESLGQDTIDRMIEVEGGIGEPRISFGYVNDDDIPELFLGFGDFHPSGVHVYTYLPERNEVVRVGEFSEFGSMDYIKRGNRIISQYGGMGSFLTVYTELSEGKPVPAGFIAQRDRKIETDSENDNDDMPDKYEIVYYAGYELPEGADGSHEGIIDWDWDDESYCVSEEEHEKKDIELQGLPENEGKLRISVKYNVMSPVDFSHGGSIEDSLAEING